MNKTTAIAIIIVCVLVAGFSFFKFVRAPGSGGISGVSSKDMTWVKCKSCGAEYQMKLIDFYQKLEASKDPKMVIVTPGLTCEKCGKNLSEPVTQFQETPNQRPVQSKVFTGSTVKFCPACGMNFDSKKKGKETNLDDRKAKKVLVGESP